MQQTGLCEYVEIKTEVGDPLPAVSILTPPLQCHMQFSAVEAAWPLSFTLTLSPPAKPISLHEKYFDIDSDENDTLTSISAVVKVFCLLFCYCLLSILGEYLQPNCMLVSFSCLTS